MALEQLVADVRALNQELPAVNEKLNQVAETAGRVVPDEAVFRASEAASRAAGEAARSTKASNDSVTTAANALAQIDPVIIPSNVNIRINDGGGGGGAASGGLIGGRTPLIGEQEQAAGGGILFDSFGNPVRRADSRTRTTNTGSGRGGRGIAPRASLLNTMAQEPSAGEQLIATKLDALTNAIGSAITTGAANIRMGSKS
jgi:hypothetical protein